MTKLLEQATATVRQHRQRKRGWVPPFEKQVNYSVSFHMRAAPDVLQEHVNGWSTDIPT